MPRNQWVCYVKGEEGDQMEGDGAAERKEGSSPISTASSSALNARQRYEKSLQGLRKIAFVTDLRDLCSWFLGFCTLTWASAILLGAYVTKLDMWDYYDISLLLFVEALYFGLATFLRLLGYCLWDFCRWGLRSIGIVLPLGMGGFAVLSILPTETRHSIHHHFAGNYNSWHHGQHHPTMSHASEPCDAYCSLNPSRIIFYVLVLANAFIILLANSVAGIMRLRYVGSNVKSLSKYHDKMLNSNVSWLHPIVDLDFAFKILGNKYRNFAFKKQGNNYRKGKQACAGYVCKSYSDLVWYLYMHEKGVEWADAVLTTGDAYTREAAANIVGFWAVLEKLEAVKGYKLPLCYQRGMLSKLADIAAESYGSLGIAAARSFAVLLKLVDLELIGMVAGVRSKSASQDLIDILLSHTAEFKDHPDGILRDESYAHICALQQYLRRLQSTDGSSGNAEMVVEDQKRQLNQKMGKIVDIQSWDDELSSLLKIKPEYSLEEVVRVGGQQRRQLFAECSAAAVRCLTRQQRGEPDAAVGCEAGKKQMEYDEAIKKSLEGRPVPQPVWANPVKASVLVLFNIAVPLVCLGVGFVVNAALSRKIG